MAWRIMHGTSAQRDDWLYGDFLNVEAMCCAESRESFWAYRRYLNPRMLIGWWQREVALELHRFWLEYLAGRRPKLLLNCPPQVGKSTQVIDFLSWIIGQSGPEPKLKVIFASFSERLGIRANIRLQRILTNPKHAKIFGHYAIDPSGRRGFNSQMIEFNGTGLERGYFRNTTVEGSVTGEGLDIGIIDDPIKGRAEANSQLTRDKTWSWLTDDFMTRFSDHAGLLLVATRWHLDDPVGRLIEHDPSVRICRYPALAEVDEVHDAIDARGLAVGKFVRRVGEPLFPELKSLEFLQQQRATMTSAGWCTPGESPVLMADLSMKPISKIEVGDEVIGFHWPRSGPFDRARLTKAMVRSISKSVRPVVKLKLSSGEYARCTPDHKWYTGRGRGRDHAQYAIACAWRGEGRRVRNGGTTVLQRVCKPCLPVLRLDQLQDAGWLGGFFDGEGCATLFNRKYGEKSVGIVFAQSEGPNLPICENLERVLMDFGFEFTVSYRVGAASLSAAATKHRTTRKYYLRGIPSRMELNQKFLHIAKPVKWRDRIIEGSRCGLMMCQDERVVEVVPDGVEMVYGLETTTGNYVVWGLASSNSSVYQQAPILVGGDMFPIEKVVLVPEPPARSDVLTAVRSWDKAGTADGLGAFSAGVLMLKMRDGTFCVADVRRGRWSALDRERMIRQTAEIDRGRYGLVKVVVEMEPGSGGKESAESTIRNLAGFSVEADRVTGAKEVRAEPFAAQWQAGNVRLVSANFTKAYLDECETFPAGRYKDQVDASSGAFNKLAGKYRYRSDLLWVS